MTAIQVMELIGKLAAAAAEAAKTGKTHVDVDAILAVKATHAANEKSAHDSAEAVLDERFPGGKS